MRSVIGAHVLNLKQFFQFSEPKIQHHQTYFESFLRVGLFLRSRWLGFERSMLRYVVPLFFTSLSGEASPKSSEA